MLLRRRKFELAGMTPIGIKTREGESYLRLIVLKTKEGRKIYVYPSGFREKIAIETYPLAFAQLQFDLQNKKERSLELEVFELNRELVSYEALLFQALKK